MFAEHQAEIARRGRATPESFRRVCIFTLATIRVALPDACRATRKWATSGELEPMAFFGHKLDGVAWLETNAAALREQTERATTSEELIESFLQIPGIGLAKAGFLAQLLYGRAGCLDTHNLVRFGLKEFKMDKGVKPETRQRHIARYLNATAMQGGPEQLWDSWCDYVGRAQGYGTAEDVSAMHLAAVA